MQQELKIREGSFWKGTEKIALEFGNVEQIKAIRRAEKYFQELSTEGFNPRVVFDVEVEATTTFDCVCGNKLQTSSEADYDGDTSCFNGFEIKCKFCKKVYIFSKEKKLVVKFKK